MARKNRSIRYERNQTGLDRLRDEIHRRQRARRDEQRARRDEQKRR